MKTQLPLIRLGSGLFLLLTAIPLFLSPLALAQSPSNVKSCVGTFNPNLFQEDAQPTEQGLVTANTISPTRLTVPSLWWAKEQFDSNKTYRGLIFNWIANPQQRQIDLIVNRQFWTLLNYIERYAFVNDWGAIVRGYDYNLRIFNKQQECLATYNCNYNISPPQCSMQMNGLLEEGFEVN
ncbi:MAG: hypothetical protein ACOC0N_00315 [Chroococcales cyanobacterium]